MPSYNETVGKNWEDLIFRGVAFMTTDGHNYLIAERDYGALEFKI